MGKPNKYAVTVTPSADQDLGGIFQYIARQLSAPDTAVKLVAKLYKTISNLTFLPKRHSLVKDVFLRKQGFRILPVDNYLIFYVTDETLKQVIIHRVLAARRNYLELLGLST
ncbi:toxin ParE [Candidatus Termititenax persephonae]|uniref:Toxin ParE n=1 Tax=Candidatus Termititenax persephonae TaxID=2218525 RepID=A0A388TG64_9BACT|nr:toxin ParE [Candidatus Termititenax persephonae]